MQIIFFKRQCPRFLFTPCCGKSATRQFEGLYVFTILAFILRQFNPKTISKWTKNTDIFSKKYLVIPICRGHHWTLVIVRTHPHISLMILDSLNKEHRSVELKITRYLQDVWSAKLPQSAKKTLEVKQIRYPTIPPQPNNRLWFVHYEMFWKVPWLCQQKLAMVVMESRILP